MKRWGIGSNAPSKLPITCWSELILIAVTGLTSVITLSWMLWYSRYGFDFTDEGFYLVWIANPFNYRVSTSQFGYLYHPLYLLLGRSISLLRQANVLALFWMAYLHCTSRRLVGPSSQRPHSGFTECDLQFDRT